MPSNTKLIKIIVFLSFSLSGTCIAAEREGNIAGERLAESGANILESNNLLTAVSPFQIRLEDEDLVIYVSSACDSEGNCRPDVFGKSIMWEARAEISSLIIPASLIKNGYPVENARLIINCIDMTDCWSMHDGSETLRQAWVDLELAMHDKRQESMVDLILTNLQSLWP